MIIILAIVAVFAIVTVLFMQQAKFGKKPSGERLELIKKSPHYKDGKFENLSHTPTLTEGYSYMGVIKKQLFGDKSRRSPKINLPSVKTNLKDLSPDENVLVWFGHSSYFMQIDGKKIVVDPVFSGNASPINGTVTSFKGTNLYSVEDLPEIDYLFISHDHYDHVDYETIVALKNKVKKVICGLGVGAHFEYWGYAPEKIIEKDWYEKVELSADLIVYVEPARHFSGRGFIRNNTLWASYVLETPSLKIYIGGDSGYDTHYAEIGKKHGPIDIAILDNGQYDLAWQNIHHLPEEVLKAAKDLNAKRIFPVHSSKFSLANHSWDEPLAKLTEHNKNYHFPLITPIIGEVVRLNDTTQTFKQWWVGLE